MALSAGRLAGGEGFWDNEKGLHIFLCSPFRLSKNTYFCSKVAHLAPTVLAVLAGKRCCARLVGSAHTRAVVCKGEFKTFPNTS